MDRLNDEFVDIEKIKRVASVKD